MCIRIIKLLQQLDEWLCYRLCPFHSTHTITTQITLKLLERLEHQVQHLMHTIECWFREYRIFIRDHACIFFLVREKLNHALKSFLPTTGYEEAHAFILYLFLTFEWTQWTVTCLFSSQLYKYLRSELHWKLRQKKMKNLGFTLLQLFRLISPLGKLYTVQRFLQTNLELLFCSYWALAVHCWVLRKRVCPL